MARVTAQSSGRAPGRVEPADGWRLGFKTQRLPDAAPDEPVSADDQAVQAREDADASARLSDALADRDVVDASLEPHYVPPGRTASRDMSEGTVPRSPFHGDPVEDARRGVSRSVHVLDQQPAYRRPAPDEVALQRLENDGQAAVADMHRAVRGGFAPLVRTRWVGLAAPDAVSAAELARVAADPRSVTDGRSLAEQARDGMAVVPPLARSLSHVRCDPALLAVVRGEHPAAALEPSLPDADRAVVGRDAVIASADWQLRIAQGAVEDAHAELCLADPAGAERVEHRWATDRRRTADAAPLGPAPEQTLTLVAAMDVRAAESAERWARLRFASRVCCGFGYAPSASRPVPDGVADAYPDLVAAVRAVDPDSPLAAVPPDLGDTYAAVLSRSIDDVRVYVPPGAEEPVGVLPDEFDAIVSARVAVSCNAGRRARDAGRPLPSPALVGAPVVSPALPSAERLARGADQRFTDVLDALRELGVRVRPAAAVVADGAASFPDRTRAAGDALELGADLAPDVDWVDGSPELVVHLSQAPAPDAAVSAFSRGAAGALGAVLSPRGSAAPGPPDVEHFSASLTARVLARPLPAGLSPVGDAGWSVAALDELGTATARVATERVHRADARTAAFARVDQVVQAFRDSGVELAERSAPDNAPVVSATYRIGTAGAPVVDVDARVLAASPALSNEALAAGHGELFVALGRATAPLTGRAGPVPRAGVCVPAGYADAASLLDGAGVACEQVLVDAFASDQLARAWPASWSSAASQAVSRQPEVLVPAPGAPEALVAAAAAGGRALRSEAVALGGRVEKGIRRASPLPGASLPEPPARPAPVAGAAADSAVAERVAGRVDR